jgi:hypothetical protein
MTTLRQPFWHRSGASTLEAVVAFTLLSTILTVVTPLVVTHGRLLASHRDYQLALEELSNQVDRLSALPEAELRTALEELAPSPLAADKLPGAELKGELAPADFGQRLSLALSWEGAQGRTPPVRMAAWVFPIAKPAANELREENEP